MRERPQGIARIFPAATWSSLKLSVIDHAIFVNDPVVRPGRPVATPIHPDVRVLATISAGFYRNILLSREVVNGTRKCMVVAGAHLLFHLVRIPGSLKGTRLAAGVVDEDGGGAGLAGVDAADGQVGDRQGFRSDGDISEPDQAAIGKAD